MFVPSNFLRFSCFLHKTDPKTREYQQHNIYISLTNVYRHPITLTRQKVNKLYGTEQGVLYFKGQKWKGGIFRGQHCMGG